MKIPTPTNEIKTPVTAKSSVTTTSTPVVQAVSGDKIEMTVKPIETQPAMQAPTQKIPITDMFIELYNLIIKYIKK